MKRRILNILIAVDQLVWVLLTLGHGEPDETISAACFRMEQAGKAQGRVFRPLVDGIFSPVEKEHCKKAFMAEMKKIQMPKEYR